MESKFPRNTSPYTTYRMLSPCLSLFVFACLLLYPHFVSIIGLCTFNLSRPPDPIQSADRYNGPESDSQRLEVGMNEFAYSGHIIFCKKKASETKEDGMGI